MIDLDEQKKAWELRDLRLCSYSQLLAPALSASPLVASSLLENKWWMLPRNGIAPGGVDPLERMYKDLQMVVGNMGCQGITPAFKEKLLPAKPQGTCGTLPPSASMAMAPTTSTTSTSTSASWSARTPRS